MDGPRDPDLAQAIDSLSFEEAFRRLSGLAASLEDGGLSLGAATARFEEGMSLVRRCNRLLDEAELKITALKDAYTPSVTEEGWEEKA
ncbi:MAG: exodeoxyribonuclease VII small subunit [Chloroflexota bacterium]